MKENTEVTLDVKPIEIGIIKLKVLGLSPYLPEPMDMDVLDKYDNKKSKQMYEKDDKSEEEKAKKKFYYTDDGDYGIPARSFYNAMIRASRYLIEKTDGGMSLFREGITVEGDILPLKYNKVKMITHWGRTSGRTRSPRKIIRNAFYDWSCELTIQFNKFQLSAEQIFNVLNWAGFHIGVGGFRKEKTGNFGAFRVDYNDK